MTNEELSEYTRLPRRINELDALMAEESNGIRPINYRGPLPRPECNCSSWGCWGCCNTEAEIRARSGIFG